MAAMGLLPITMTKLARNGAPTTDGSPTAITALGFETGAARAILRQIHQAHLM
jgi:hypothetical protein